MINKPLNMLYQLVLFKTFWNKRLDKFYCTKPDTSVS